MSKIRIEEILTHSPYRVWEELNPRELSQWYRGRAKTQFELAPGESFRAAGEFKLFAKNGTHDSLLQAKARTTPEGLTLLWDSREPEEDWTVIWRLEPAGEADRTRLIVVDRSEPRGKIASLIDRFLGPSLLRRRYSSSLRKLRARLGKA